MSLYRAFSTLRPFGLLYSYPQQVPAFISRGATHHTDAWELYQRRRELLTMNFASKSVIYGNPLGSFTCRKAGTWDISFYFPSEGRHTEDFLDPRKIQRLRPGLNPRTRAPVASMLTTRPPKPSYYYRCSCLTTTAGMLLLLILLLPPPQPTPPLPTPSPLQLLLQLLQNYTQYA